MSGHAIAFHCPYCGDEDLRPHEPTDGSAGHGQWECRSCTRAFAVKFLGLLPRRSEPAPQGADQGGTS